MNLINKDFNKQKPYLCPKHKARYLIGWAVVLGLVFLNLFVSWLRG